MTGGTNKNKNNISTLRASFALKVAKQTIELKMIAMLGRWPFDGNELQLTVDVQPLKPLSFK